MTTNAESCSSSSPTPGTAIPGRRSLGWRVASVGSAGLLASAAGTAALLSGIGAAGAATFDVTNCDDTGAGSLRDAIATADSTAGADTITISATCTLANPVDVAGGEMVMTSPDDISIVGPGSGLFVLDADGASRIMRLDGVGNVEISGITMRGGDGTGGTNYGDGGAMLITGASAVHLSGVVFDANDSTAEGGALYIDGSDSVTITGCTFSNNSSTGGGGAFYSLYNGPIVISNSTFVGNTAGGQGGAISVYENPGTFTMTNSTLTGNSAGQYGGAVSFPGLYDDATFLFNTITDNTAANVGGVYIAAETSTVTMIGNIVSGNTATANDHQVMIGSGWTVETSSNDFHGSVDGFTPDASDLDVDPLLEELADNGGPTMTRALPANSPVIDLGPAVLPEFEGNGFDQRGTPFVREYNGRSDIGAFEWAPTEEPTTTTTTTVTPSTDPSSPVVPNFTG